ncbi:MAG: spermidine/putrescine ABC transporter substrate-binding protein [Elusimicrobia bacterium]|nr:spermidine/putrescine ABC transporter substrate-binding protein [Elusimicrobiota bacterium]
MRATRRDFLRIAALAAVGGLPALEACRGRDPNTVNFFNWFNYIGKETLPRFEKEAGIKVNYEVYSSEEEMFSKLKAGVRGYDLFVATDYMIPRLKAMRLLDPVPHDILKNLRRIAPRFRDPSYDPGLLYTIPYLWGTTGIGYNARKLAKPPQSWWSLWDERYKGRVSMLDNLRDGIGVALLLTGSPLDSKDPAQLEKARDLLLKQRGILKQYSSSTFVDDLVSGELWLAQGWSGDVLQAARENTHVDYVIPKEGSFIWVDSLCLIRGAGRRAEVLRLVDYLLSPEVGAEISNSVRYATPNAEAIKRLEPTLRNDPRVYPPPAVEARLQFYAPLDPEADELWNRAWQEVKIL